MENMRLPESYLIDALPDNPESVLDVWAGHSEIFNFEEWEKRNLKKKTYTDIILLHLNEKFLHGYTKIISI